MNSMIIIKPGDVSPRTSKRILSFLNKVEATEEVARIISLDAVQESREKIRKRDAKVAQQILSQRNRTGKFQNLEELLDIPRIGPTTFSNIVRLFENEEGTFADESLERERLEFRALLLENPNYFGNLNSSLFQPVKPMKSNTKFEEMVCLSSNPDLNYGAGLVLIKMEEGYTNTRLRNGTYEYVHFYADWDNNGDWKFLGTAQSIFADLPGPKPLVYALSFDIKPPSSFIPGLVKVRAILSWNMRPPAGEPDFVPVWGNVLESEIEIGQGKRVTCTRLSVDGEQDMFPAPVRSITNEPDNNPPGLLNMKQLSELYKDNNVPATRFAYPGIWRALETQGYEESDIRRPLEGLNGDAPAIIEGVLRTKGNTDYEELTFVAFDPERLALVGTVKLKQARGYTTGTRAGGSHEYLSFWVWNEKTRSWSYLGTSGVNVHDLPRIPPQGLYYAVSIPIDTRWLTSQSQEELAKMRILATLSWENPPPPNPDWQPAWGNSFETIIIPAYHHPITEGIVHLEAVGGIKINYDTTQRKTIEINLSRHPDLSTDGRDYLINIAGTITSPPNVLAGDLPYKYKVSLRKCLEETAGTWTPWWPLTNAFPITKTRQDGVGVPVSYDEVQKVDPSDDYYIYCEQNDVDQWLMVVGKVLASWQVPGSITGLWEVRVEAKKPDGTPIDGHVFHNGRLLRKNQVRVRFIDRCSSPETC